MSDPTARLNTALEGRYRIERELGQGGMATVYLAHDVRHDRPVALKVLKPELAAVVGAERFLGEIKTTANLQQPHILPLFDSGEADSFLFFVMPYVEGESLRDRLDREGELPVEEAVRIATAVASALDYAHRHGVIHRDIKPANILLHDGQPVVADFGIALAVSAAGGGRLTETGLSLGTPYYMSPEQATADRDPDRRSDVYSLGCLLYEMLVGEPPYTGSSAQAVLGKILTTEPVRPTEHRRSVPAHVEAAVMKALEKRPADRFGSAAEFSAALSDSTFRYGGPLATGAGHPAHRWAASRVLPWALAGVSLVALAALGFGLLTGRWSASPTAGEVTRMPLMLPEGHAVTSAPVISPDGRIIAYTAADAAEPARLYIRRLDAFEPEVVMETEGAESPFFSPDGQSIAYFAQGRLFRLNLGGAGPQYLADAPFPNGGTWGGDDVIVFAPVWNGGLFQVPASDGPALPEALLVPDRKEESAFIYPRFVPGREEVLFLAGGGGSRNGIGRLSLVDRGYDILIPGASSGRVTTSGHLLFRRGASRSLLATPYPAGSGAAASAPSVLSGVHTLTWTADLWLDVSQTGTLVYAPSDISQRSLVRVDQSGNATPLSDQRGLYSGVALSPDARWVAADDEGWLWLYDLERGGRVRLAPENRGCGESDPIWDLNSERVIYGSCLSGDWELYARVPGTAESELLLQKEFDQVPHSISMDGTLAILESNPATGDDIWLLPPGGPPTAWQVTTARESHPDFSPGGNWLAYSSDVSGRFEVYVGSVRDGSERHQLTTEGGQAPVWSPKGDRIFYRRGATMMAVDVVGLDPIRFGAHHRLFEPGWSLPAPEQSYLRTYDVTPDGEHFIMVRNEPEAIPDRIIIVLNWFEELKRLVPVN